MTTRFKSLRSGLMAIGLALVATLWMLSGLVRNNDAETSESVSNQRTASQSGATENSALPRVAIEKSLAQTMTREIVISARTQPNREVEVRAETDGRIVGLGAERGQAVATNDHIANLDMRDRNVRLEDASARIAQRELQYQAAIRLEGQKLVSEAQIAEARAELVSARASLEQIQLDLEYTNIVAPFDAFLDDRFVEIGDYVQSGDAIARLVDTDPLIVVGEVSEREVLAIESGSPGMAKMVNGETVAGIVRYVAPVADENTRTFRVELAIPNPSGKLRAGMTAEMRLEAEQITAHSLSPALLTLDDEGAVGVKSVDDAGRVAFHPVEIVSSSERGILVTGLPQELHIIIVGQGFVMPGQAVEAVADPAAARQPAIEHSGTAPTDATTPRS